MALPSGTGPHPLYRLPIEIILEITDRLPLEDFISFAFAHYPLLRHHGLVPAMSVQELSLLHRRSRLPSLFCLVPLPVELLLQTMRFLRPLDTMRFVFANYQHLAHSGIAPFLSADVIRALGTVCPK